MRVVSLVPSLTETLHALGAWDDVAAVTSFCVHPETARKEKEVVGGTKSPNVGKILTMEPDLVVVNKEENRLEDVQRIREAGIEVLVTDVRSVGDAARMVLRLGEAVDRVPEAEAMAGRIEDAVEDVRRARGDARHLPVFCPIWKDPWMTFNGDTYPHAVLRLAGAANPWADDDERYPETSLQDVVNRDVEAVLLPSEPYEFTEADVPDLNPLGLPREALDLVDGEALTWYGARTPEGLREVQRVVAEVHDALEAT